MEIRIVKLVRGEQFVASVEYDAEKKEYRAKTPVVFQATPEGIVARPWLVYDNDEDITLKAEHVLCTARPESNLEAGYREKFGSGLVVPSQELII